jgi:hypothetical protein
LVGDTLLCGSGASQEQAIVEEAPSCGPIAAEPNYGVIAESTGKLVGNLLELEDLGARNLKGIAGSVCVNEQLERLIAGP